MALHIISKSYFFKLSKQYLFALITLFTFSQGVYSQGICDDIDPFCSGTNLTFPNVNNGSWGPTGIDYGDGVGGCGNSYNKNPVWYYLKIGSAGPIALQISQTNGDVDFAMWGPYSDLASGCSQVSNGHAPIQWSYSGAASENVGIGTSGGSNSVCNGGQTTPPLPNVGDVYIVMITNWDGSSGSISLTQQNEGGAGAGSTDCNILAPCQVGNVTINGDAEFCAGQSTTITASGGTGGIIYYQGTTNNGTSTANSSTNQTISNPGTYYFRAYNSADDCWGSQTSITITQKPSPTGVSATADRYEICEGESVQLYGQGALPGGGNTNLYSASNASDFAPWTIAHNGNNTGAWNKNFSGTNAGGTSSPEIRYNGSSFNNADGRLQSPLIDATGCSALSLSFKHYIWHYSSSYNYNISVQISTNGTTWTNVYSVAPVTSSVGPVTQNINLNAYAGQSFYIRFRVTGEEFGLHYWYIDDIAVNCAQPSIPDFVWSPGGSLDDPNAQNPIATPATTTTYTLTVENNGCTVTDQVTIVVNPEVTPTFTQLPPFCQNSTAPTLPTTSTNGISGTWSPTTVSNTTVGNTTYTFTPAAGQCALPETMIINVIEEITPTFAQIPPFCQGTTAPTLPATSTNGITGTWNPATVSNTAVGNTTYTFTPAVGQCATTQTMVINVTPRATPIFTQLPAFCQGTTAPTLPTTSTNGIAGTWNPVTVSNTTVGNTTYTFTPTAGVCATSPTMTINVTPTPTLTVNATDPTACGGNGSINFTFTNVDDGTYTIGGFTGVVVTGGSATVNALAGTYTGLSITNQDGCPSNSAAATLTDPNAPDAPTFTVVAPTCLADGSAVIANYDNTATYTFIPAGPSVGGGGVITGALFGQNYSVEIDLNSCKASASFQISEQLASPVVPTFAITAPTCTAVGSAQINGYNLALTYTIAPNAATISAGGEITGAAGTYTITSENADGCQSSAQVTIEEELADPTLALVAIDPTTCGGNGSINFTFTNVDDGTYTIGTFTGVVVTGGIATVNAPAGTYTGLSITNQDGCPSNNAAATLTDPNAPDAPTFTVVAPTCLADGSAVIANYDNTATYTFIPVGPSVGAGGVITGALFGQNYSVEIDLNSCKASASFQVSEQLASPVVPTFTITAPTCTAVGSAQINGYDLALTYTIAPNTAAISAGGEITGAAGTYTITSENADGCQSSAQVTIEEELADPTLTVNATDPTACGGNGSINFTFTNVDDGTYTIGGFTGVVVAGGTATVNAPAGTYTGLSITNQDGCPSNNAAATLTDPNAPDASTFTVVAPTCLADGSAVIANYDNTATYTFIPAGPSVGGGGVITGALFGQNYSVEIDLNSCKASASFQIEEQLASPVVPTFAITAPTCTAVGSAQINGYNLALTYTIAPNTAAISAGGEITGAAGTYTITSENTDGCQSSAQVTIEEELADPTLTVNATDPTACGGNGSINFTFTNVDDGTYTIGGFTGVVVAGGTATVNAPAGTYTGLSITNQDGCPSNSAAATLTDPNAPDAPTFTVVAPTCLANGSAVIANYDNTATYTFIPAGPSVGGGGVITGALVGQNYSVEIDLNSCKASASFQIEEQLASPVVPTFAITAPTCTAVGSAQINGYNLALTYTIAPNTAAISAGGEITGAAGTYTITSENTDGCQSSAQVTIEEELADPTLALAAIEPTTCGGNGSINFTFTNVDDGTYTIGTFTGVVVAGGTAAVNAPAGTYTGLSITNQDGCPSNSAAATLTDPNAPDAPTFTVVAPTCLADGSAVIANYDNTATYTFIPAGPSVGGGGVITGALFGQNYSVEIDLNSCKASASFQIEEQLASPVVPTFVITAPTCTAVGSAQINGYNLALTYTITPNTATISAGGEITGAAGTYTITSENTDGCQSSAQVTIEEELADPTLTVNATDPTACGGNGSINFTFTNVDDGTYTIGTFTGVLVTGGTATVNAPAGTYTGLSIANQDGCPSNSAAATLTDPNAPDAPTFTVVAPTCLADGSAVIANYDNTATYTFIPVGPSVGGGGVITGALVEQNYSVEIDLNSCKASASFQIAEQLASPVVPTFTVTAPTCTATGFAQVNGYDLALTYTIAPNTAAISAGGEITGAAGTYTITSENTDGCQSSAQVTIEEELADPTLSVTVTQPAICGGDGSINFTFTDVDDGAYTIGAFNGVVVSGGTATIPVPEGTYNGLGMNNQNGCPSNTVTASLTDPNPPAINAGLDQEVCAGGTTTVTANNPDGATITWNNGVTDGNVFIPPVGTTTYTVTAVLAGCTSSDQMTITVSPSITDITCPGPLTATCDISEQPAYVSFNAFIAAGGSASIPVNGVIDSTSFVLISEVSDGNTCPETVTRTYQIADTCGVTVTCSQIIMINDLIDPTGTAPAALTVQCIGDVPAADPSLVTDAADNCTANPTVTHVSDVSDGNTCPEIITRTYNIADDCGNNINVEQIITIQDDIDPTGTAPANLAVQCIGEVPAADIALITDAADNCTAIPIVSHVSDVSNGSSCSEVITRTYNIADACGNNVDVVQTITINDDTNPTASNPLPLTVECLSDVPAADIAVVTDAADNCTVNPIVAFVSESSDANTCNGELITRIYSVTDDCGNSINVTQTITIDSYTPTFTVSSSNPTTCGGNDGTITLSGLDPSTGFGMSYNGGGVNPITTTASGEYVITGLSAGSYIDYTVSDADCPSCKTTVNAVVNLVDPNAPSINAGVDQEFCTGMTTTVSAINPDGANISWDNGVTDGIGFVPPVGTTNYTVTAELANCFSTDVLTILVHPLPTVTAGTDVEVCEGSLVTLSGSGANTYVWDNGVSNGIGFFPPVGTTSYKVVGTSIHGCEGSSRIEVTVHPTPVVLFAADVTSGCMPLEVNLSSLSGATNKCKFTIDGNTEITGCDVNYTFDSPGCHDVTLEVESMYGCVNDSTAANYICIDDFPIADFTVNPDGLSSFVDEAIFTNGSTGAETYEWNFGDGYFSNETHPSHVYSVGDEDAYTITLIAYSELGCPDTAYTVLPFIEDLLYFIPNSFTPDGSHYNEVFTPVFTSGFDPQGYTFKVFNRWGEIIFESNNTAFGWDGTYGVGSSKGVPEGVYVWTIDFKKKSNDDSIRLTGHVNLIR